MNRYGYPEENSLISVDMHTAKTDSAKPMLRGLSGKQESTFDSPLVEGKTGRFLALERTADLGISPVSVP